MGTEQEATGLPGRPATPGVAGIGGVFFKARDPAVLAAWYREHLGVPVAEGGLHAMFTSPVPDSTGAPMQTVWSAFPAKTGYFGPGVAQLMINYRVSDLDAMLEWLRAAGVPVEERIDESEYGRFGWATDPEGNRFELWQPPRGGIPGE
jgi:predicted enzyme related to lactoylglutathione lyase